MKFMSNIRSTILETKKAAARAVVKKKKAPAREQYSSNPDVTKATSCEQ